MIFQHTWQAVLEGRKTQTRRIVKPKEILSTFMTDEHPHWMPCVMTRVGGPAKWYAQHTYAVQPGRGKPAIWWRDNAFGLEYAHTCYDIDNDLWDIHGGYPTEDYKQASDYEHLEGKAAELREYGYTEARIRVTDIRREDVRGISDEDVKAEGFESRKTFLDLWTLMHDKEAHILYSTGLVDGEPVAYIRNRPAERYQAWVITFELVQS